MRDLRADEAEAHTLIDEDTANTVECAVSHAWDDTFGQYEDQSGIMPEMLALSALACAESAARDMMQAAYTTAFWTLQGHADYTEAGNPAAAADRGLTVIYGAAYFAALTNIRACLA